MKQKTDVFGEISVPPYSTKPEDGDFLLERPVELPTLTEEARMVAGNTLPPPAATSPTPVKSEEDEVRGIMERIAKEAVDPKDRAVFQEVLKSDYVDYVTGKKESSASEPALTPPVRASSRPPRSAYLEDIISAADAPPKSKSPKPPAIPKAALMVNKENAMTEKKAVPPPLPDLTGTVAEGTAFEAVVPVHDPSKTTMDVEMAPVEESKAGEPARTTKDLGDMFVTPDPADGLAPHKPKYFKRSCTMLGFRPKPRRRVSFNPKAKAVARKNIVDPALALKKTAADAVDDDLLSDTNGHATPPTTPPPPLPKNDVMKRRNAITGLVIGIGLVVVVGLAVFLVGMMRTVKKLADAGSATIKIAIPATVIAAKKAKSNDAGLAATASAMGFMDFTEWENENGDKPINFTFSYEADKNSPIYKFAKGLERPAKVADCFPKGSKLRAEDVTWCCLGLMNTKKSRVSSKEMLDVSRCMIWKEQAKFAWWKAENAKAKSLASNSN